MKYCVLTFTNYRENILNLKGKPATGLLLLPSLGIDSIYTNWRLNSSNWHFTVLDSVINNYSKEETLKRLVESEPDVAGFSASYLNLQDAIWIAKELKHERPETVTVLGGLGAKSIAAITAKDGIEGVDICVLEDGEPAFQHIRNHKPTGKTVYLEERVENLNLLSFPTRECFNIENYIKVNQRYSPIGKHGKVLNIYTSKGCGWGRCIFCTAERGCRTRDLENIRRELDYLMDKYSITHLILCDDDFNSRSDVYEVSRLLGEYEVEWTVEMRVNAVTGEQGPSLLKTMGENGCVQILWGAESGDSRTLKTLGKGMTPDAVIKAINLASKAGIRSTLSFMYDVPGENEERFSNTVSMIKKIIQNYPKQINSILLFEYASIPGSRGWAEEIKESKLPKEKVAQLLGELNELCKEAEIPFIPQKFAASIPEKSRRTA